MAKNDKFSFVKGIMQVMSNMAYAAAKRGRV